MNDKLWGTGTNPVSLSLIVASGALLQWTLSSLATRGTDEETEHSTKTKKHKRTAAILEDQEWKHQE